MFLQSTFIYLADLLGAEMHLLDVRAKRRTECDAK